MSDNSACTIEQRQVYRREMDRISAAHLASTILNMVESVKFYQSEDSDKNIIYVGEINKASGNMIVAEGGTFYEMLIDAWHQIK